MISRNALEPTYGNRFIFDPFAPTRWLARAITDSTKNAGENIGFAILHVSFGELSLRNHSNIRGHVSMRGAAPLAVNYLMKVLRVGSICWLHSDART